MGVLRILSLPFVLCSSFKLYGKHSSMVIDSSPLPFPYGPHPLRTLFYRSNISKMRYTAVASLLSSFAATSFSQMVNMGAAGTFAVFAGSITNTGISDVRKNIGTYPSSSVSGFPPGIAEDTTHLGDAAAATAHADLQTAINMANALPCGTDLTGKDLGGMTLGPGVYCFSSLAYLNGDLNLDAGGNPNAEFVFKVESGLIVGNKVSKPKNLFYSDEVLRLDGVRPCAVTWVSGSSSVMVASGTLFVGNILSSTGAINLSTAVIQVGGSYSLKGSVSLNSAFVIGAGSCPSNSPPPTTSSSSSSTSTNSKHSKTTTSQAKTAHQRTHAKAPTKIE